MKIMMINIKPFTLSQTISIFENNLESQTFSISMSQLPNFVVNIAESLEIKDIKISGAKLYTQGIQKKIQKVEETKYNKNILNIELI